MSDTKSIVIAVFGLSSREERILHTICFISRTRPRTYELMLPGSKDRPDITLVDGNDPKAIVDWQQFDADNPMVPIVIVGESAQVHRAAIKIDRPLMATRLLAVFDEIPVSDEHPAFAQQGAGGEVKHLHDNTQVKAVPQNQQKTQKLSALVVDDSLPIRMQMQKELEQFVGHVDLAETGEQAVELVANNDYNIIFLDVVLPGIDGYQICKGIKRDKRTKSVPVVMLTGKSSPFDRVRGKLAGCDTYLTKPVDLPTFKEVVQQYLFQQML